MTTPITVFEILIYPIKSLGAIRLASNFALEKGFRYDRRYLLVDDNGQFLTQREHHMMGLLQPALHGDHWQVTAGAEKNSQILFPLEPPHPTTPLTVNVWDDFCEALPYPARINDWFSEQLGIACTLVFLHEGLGSVRMWRDWPALLCAQLGCAGLVWAVSMAKQEHMRVAWRVARKDALRRATALKVELERRARDAEAA